MQRLRKKKHALFANIWCVGKQHPTPKFNIIYELFLIQIRRVLFSNAPQTHHKTKAHQTKNMQRLRRRKHSLLANIRCVKKQHPTSKINEIVNLNSNYTTIPYEKNINNK